MSKQTERVENAGNKRNFDTISSNETITHENKVSDCENEVPKKKQSYTKSASNGISAANILSNPVVSLSQAMASTFRPGRLSQIEILKRLFPIQKSNVLNLVLQGCNGDLVKAIEHFLSANEPVRSNDIGKFDPAISPKYILSPYGSYSSSFPTSAYECMRKDWLDTGVNGGVVPPEQSSESLAFRTVPSLTDVSKSFGLSAGSYLPIPTSLWQKQSNQNVPTNSEAPSSNTACTISPNLLDYQSRTMAQPSLLNAFSTLRPETLLSTPFLFPSTSEKISSLTGSPALPALNCTNPFLLPFGLYASHPLLSGAKSSFGSSPR